MREAQYFSVKLFFITLNHQFPNCTQLLPILVKQFNAVCGVINTAAVNFSGNLIYVVAQ